MRQYLYKTSTESIVGIQGKSPEFTVWLDEYGEYEFSLLEEAGGFSTKEGALAWLTKQYGKLELLDE